MDTLGFPPAPNLHAQKLLMLRLSERKRTHQKEEQQLCASTIGQDHGIPARAKAFILQCISSAV